MDLAIFCRFISDWNDFRKQ